MVNWYLQYLGFSRAREAGPCDTSGVITYSSKLPPCTGVPVARTAGAFDPREDSRYAAGCAHSLIAFSTVNVVAQKHIRRHRSKFGSGTALSTLDERSYTARIGAGTFRSSWSSALAAGVACSAPTRSASSRRSSCRSCCLEARSTKICSSVHWVSEHSTTPRVERACE